MSIFFVRVMRSQTVSKTRYQIYKSRTGSFDVSVENKGVRRAGIRW